VAARRVADDPEVVARPERELDLAVADVEFFEIQAIWRTGAARSALPRRPQQRQRHGRRPSLGRRIHRLFRHSGSSWWGIFPVGVGMETCLDERRVVSRSEGRNEGALCKTKTSPGNN
jgi:hypothetical protein